MRPPIYLVELPTLTPREVALKSIVRSLPDVYGPNADEPHIQFATLCVEIARAEKRYAAEQKVKHHDR